MARRTLRLIWLELFPEVSAQVSPFRIDGVNECVLLNSSPALESFFSPNRIPHVLENFNINETERLVLSYERAFVGGGVVPVTVVDAIRYTGIKSTARTARKHVHVIAARTRHAADYTARSFASLRMTFPEEIRRSNTSFDSRRPSAVNETSSLCCFNNPMFLSSWTCDSRESKASP